MDPAACLLEARAAFIERDYETCSERLQDYEDWRRKGGFEPKSMMFDDDDTQFFDGDFVQETLLEGLAVHG